MVGRALLFLATSLGLASPSSAQLFSYEREAPRPVQAVTFVVSPIDFDYRGGGDPADRFDFADVGLGVQYVRPNLHVAVLFGSHTPDPDAEDLRLIDASLFTWGEFSLTGRPASGSSRIFIPVLIHSGHRRVAVKDEASTDIDAFSVTVLGLGTGVGFGGHFGKIHLEARATPIIGLATRSFGDASGSSTLFDGDVSLHLVDLVGRFGISAGYGFRAQSWNVGSSSLLEDGADDLFDYKGTQQVLRIGISW